ncbi:MAG: asparagine synthase (glutamine-hydrolyzing) [Thermoplasmata archaeon]
MCGICGIYSPKIQVDEGIIQIMKDSLVHRGPDDEGSYFDGDLGLGFRRLSILDLETGNQPMANEDQTVWVVYNGELYNYLDLKETLEKGGHKFSTTSDTETLLHAYEEWGMDFLNRLNGMFAFAIWDKAKRRLMLARDRVGVKPLYYFYDGEKLAFASEMKSLILCPGVPRSVNRMALLDYLTYQSVFGQKTFFDGIQKLLPGHFLVYDGEKVDVQQYWDLVFDESGAGDEDHYAQSYRTLLNQSVEMQLMSDVPVGFHLSGGLDSSSVVLAASEHMKDFKTFSGRFPERGFDESRYAHEVASMVGAEEYEMTLQAEDLSRMIQEILWFVDSPRGGPGVIPQYHVAMLASQHVKVVLTGHGGDELFAGYPVYLVPHIMESMLRKPTQGGVSRGREMVNAMEDIIPRGRVEGFRRILGLPAYSIIQKSLRKYARATMFSKEELSRLLLPDVTNQCRGYQPEHILDAYLERTNAKSALNKLIYLDVKTYLPTLLANEDKTSMAFSLEARVPILDDVMVELSRRIPAHHKISGLTLKNIPRKAAKGILPTDVISHKKLGFPVPIATWFRTDLKSYLYDTLLSPDARKRGFLNAEYVEKILDKHMRGVRNHSDKLWCLLNFELWNRLYIDPEKPTRPT